MKAIKQWATDQIDMETGFRCRTVMLRTEPPVLHSHDYYELFLVLSDGIVHIINGREEVLPRGTLIFIRKDDTHMYDMNHNSECFFVNLAFTENITEKLFAFLEDNFPTALLLGAEEPPRVLLDEIGIQKILTELDTINTISVGNHRQTSLAYRRLLVKIFCKYFAEFTDESTSSLPLWLKEFDMKMHQIACFSMNSGEVVRLSGRSREHLARSVRRYYGVPLSDYVNGIRLNYVANSLVNTDLTITELFYNAGFNNLSYAFTLFKRKFGASPREFKKTTFTLEL